MGPWSAGQHGEEKAVRAPVVTDSVLVVAARLAEDLGTARLMNGVLVFIVLTLVGLLVWAFRGAWNKVLRGDGNGGPSLKGLVEQIEQLKKGIRVVYRILMETRDVSKTALPIMVFSTVPGALETTWPCHWKAVEKPEGMGVTVKRVPKTSSATSVKAFWADMVYS